MRRSLMLVAGGALLLALAVPAGAGQTERFKTKVTLRDQCELGGGTPAGCRAAARQRNYSARFYGSVRSDKATCERRRTVKLVRTETFPAGRRGKLEATTKSDREGTWEIVIDKPPWGMYVAKVTAKRKGDVVCKPDQSRPERHELELG